MTTAPVDWDAESYCVEDGCRRPATHERLVGFGEFAPVYEMVCCTHALKETT